MKVKYKRQVSPFTEETFESDRDYANILVHNVSIPPDLHTVSLAHSIIENSRLAGFNCRMFSMTDTDIIGSDISNSDWTASSIIRTTYKESKLTGLIIAESRVKETMFLHCTADYLQGHKTLFQKTVFERCNLTSADFAGAMLNGCIFKDCDLTDVDFSGASLKGADLRGSILTRMHIGIEELQGITIDASQAITIAATLGMTIA